MVRDCENSPKRLVLLIKKQTQRSDGISSLTIHENSLIFTRKDVAKDEVISEYLSKMFSADDGERSALNYNGALSMDLVSIEGENVLLLLHDIKPDEFRSPDDIHPRIMKGLADVIVGPLAIVFVWQFRFPKRGVET